MNKIDTIREAMNLICAIAVTHGLPVLTEPSHMDDRIYTPASLEEPGIGGLYIEASEEGVKAICFATRRDWRSHCAQETAMRVIAALDPTYLELKAGFGADLHLRPSRFHPWGGGFHYYAFMNDVKALSAHELMEAPERLEGLMVAVGVSRSQAQALILGMTEDHSPKPRPGFFVRLLAFLQTWRRGRS
jgi:hypothetical protein